MDFTIRNILAWGLASFLILTGCVRRAKQRALAGEFILSVYFHNPTVKEFEACVRWLLKNKFNFITLHDVEQFVNERKALPSGSVLITVDDGWALNEAAVVRIAQKYNIPAGIFISTGPVEEGVYWWSYVDEARRHKLTSFSKKDLKKMTDDERLATVEELKSKVKLPRESLTVEQVKAIAQSPLITIGGHTHTHPILINCNDRQVYDELHVSKLKLESWLNKEVKFFAYPNGSYSDREIKLLHKTNYSLAFTTEPSYLTSKALEYRYELPRFEVYQGGSAQENICRLVGVWQPALKRISALVLLFKRRISFIQSLLNKSSVLSIGYLSGCL